MSNKVIVRLNKLLTITTSISYYAMRLQKELTPYVVVENKAYMTNINMGISVKDVLQQFNLAKVEYEGTNIKITMPLGLWDYVKDLHSLAEAEVINEIPNFQPEQKDIDYMTRMMVGDYSYQRSAVEEMLKHNHGILEARPGSGKTAMGITLAALKGKSVLWINDRIELAKQAYNTAVNLLGFNPEDCGLLQGDKEHISKYTFTTIQKLTKVINRGFNDPLQKLQHWDVIIIDECHHTVGSYNSYNTYFQALNELSYNYVYGLTATVERVDGNEHLVHAILGTVKYTEESKTKTIPAEVVRKTIKILTPEIVYESMVNMYTGKAIPARVTEWLLFHEDYIKAVEPYIDHALKNYNKILIVSPRVAGAQMWSDHLTECGIDNFLVYGAIKKRERLYTDKVIVATLDLIKEGFDVVDLECILVLGRPIHKQIEVQVIGRAERYHPNKLKPKVYFLTPEMFRPDRPKKAPWLDLDLNNF